MKDIAETRNIHKDIRTGEGNSRCQTASLNIYPKNMLIVELEVNNSER